MGKIYCCAKDCHGYSGRKINDRKVSMHRFPARRLIQRIWIDRVKNHCKSFRYNSKTSRLCSEHFVGFEGPSSSVPIPSIFPQKVYKTHSIDEDSFCTPQTDGISSEPQQNLEELGEQSNIEVDNDHPLNVSLHMHDYIGEFKSSSAILVEKYCQTDPVEIIQLDVCDKGCQTDRSGEDSTTQNDVKLAKPEMEEVSTQCDLPELTIEDLKDSDDDVMFYTGFPTFLSFMMLFNTLMPLAKKMSYWKGEKWNRVKKYQTNGSEKPGPKRKLKLIDEFFLVFMRLRLGLLEEDLARRFRISVSTCSSIWRTWIKLLSQKMVPLLLFWPSKDSVQSNMPDSFRIRYPSTRVILDCTEIRSETPESTKAKSLLYSNYKSHMTWKVLVGITPAGVPCLVSDCYSGSTSDKEITQLSGVIDLCESGDAIMCDQGFLIESLITAKNISIVRPAFKKCHTKFSRREVEETRRIANLRIHVEREMQRIKIFRILNGVMPICSHDTVTDVFRVCTAMTSLYPALVQH